MKTGLSGNAYRAAGMHTLGAVRPIQGAQPPRTCWRCGVEFDATKYLPGAPCIDCQDEVPEPEFGWLQPRDLKRQMEEEFDRKTEGIVRDLYAQGYNDPQIAERIGYSHKWVQAYRGKLGLPIQPKVVLGYEDPITADQRLKHKRAMESYDWSSRRVRGEDSRKDNAANRLKYGWPEETAYWQLKSMKEAGLDVHRHSTPISGE